MAGSSLATAVDSGVRAGRCGTCKHWWRYTDGFDVKYHGDRTGVCISDKFRYCAAPPTPRDGLRYWDHEGFSAGFDTGEDFGCVHWSRR